MSYFIHDFGLQHRVYLGVPYRGPNRWVPSTEFGLVILNARGVNVRGSEGAGGRAGIDHWLMMRRGRCYIPTGVASHTAVGFNYRIVLFYFSFVRW